MIGTKVGKAMKRLFHSRGKGADTHLSAPRPGPSWDAYDVMIVEYRIYRGRVYGFSKQHVEKKAWSIFANAGATGELSCGEIEDLNMTVEKAR